MKLCEASAPPPKGRKNANRQPCGAIAVEGEKYCAAHLSVFNPPCAKCGARRHLDQRELGRLRYICPNGCDALTLREVASQ